MWTRLAPIHALLFVAAAAAFSSPAAAAEASAAAAPRCSHAGSAPANVSTSAAAHALRCLINDVRREHGLRAVRENRRLASAARRHAGDMAANDFFAHDSPRTGSMKARVERAGYLRSVRAWSLGEAIAWGKASQGAPRAILKGLLASPPHRAILLSPAFRDVGVGVARGAPSGRNRGAVTVALDFGAVRR